MNPIVLGQVRAVLAWVGGLVTGYGGMSAGSWELWSGVALGLIPAVWSAVEKLRAAR